MIFVDSNIPMHLVGAAHANKDEARRLVEQAVVDGERLVTDAEVFQEMLRRYAAIRRREAIEPAFELLLSLVDEVLPIELADIQRARRLLGDQRLSARDALHIAVMQRHDIGRVLTFDRAFDLIAGVERVQSGAPPRH